jgi:prefoldin subunit 5
LSARTDTELISVAVGFGFYAQMTPTEAIKFCGDKMALLKAKEEHLERKSETIQGHIKELLLGVEQLKQSSRS